MRAKMESRASMLKAMFAVPLQEMGVWLFKSPHGCERSACPVDKGSHGIRIIDLSRDQDL